MKLKKSSIYLPLILSAIATANAAPITRSATADNLNLTGAWTGAVAPTGADVATWDALSTLTNTLGANLTWGGINTSAAGGAVTISGANSLTLAHSTSGSTVLNVGTNDFTYNSSGQFNINTATGGATFSGSSIVTIGGNGTKNWKNLKNINFTGTLRLRGGTGASGAFSNNWLAFSDAAITPVQTGSFHLDTGASLTDRGDFIVTDTWGNGAQLNLASLTGFGDFRSDWSAANPFPAVAGPRTIAVNQSTNTTFNGRIIQNNATNRQLALKKEGTGTLTLVGNSNYTGPTTISGGTLQLGDGGTTGTIGAGALVNNGALVLNHGTGAAIILGNSISGAGPLTKQGLGSVAFTGDSSTYTGNISLELGSIRMGPNLGTGTLTVKNGTFISPGLAATNGTSVIGGLTLEDATESDFRIGVANDKIDVTNTGGLTVPATGETHTINILNTPTGGGTIKLIDYAGTALTAGEFSRFTLGTTPGGAATFALVNNTADTSIDLLITLENQVWKGSTDANWIDDGTTTNWAKQSTPGTPEAFNSGHPSVFDDTAALFAVTVDAAGVNPTIVTFSNAANAYTLTGGSISGTGALVKGGAAATTLSTPLAYTGGTTVNAGTLTLDGATNTSSGGTIITGGKLQIGSGATTGDLGSGAVSVAAGATLEFNRSNAVPGTADLNYKTTAKLRDVSGAGDIVLTGGVLLFNYTGAGVGFSEAGSWNNFSGNLTIKGGSEFQTIRNGATAMGSGDIILGDGSSSGILSQIEGNWTWTNDISLVGSDNKVRNRSAGASRTLKLQGVISGAGGLTFEDPAVAMTEVNRGFILTAANTLNGTLTIATGVPVRVGGAPGNLDTATAGNSGSLGAATVVNNGTLTFSRNDAHTVANAISGSGSLRVGIPAAAALGNTTLQVLTYTGTASHTGATTVNNGKLIVDSGASLGGSSVNIAATGTLGGTGTVAAPLTAAGIIAPGTSIGTLPVTGDTAVTGTLAIEVDGATVDKLSVTGDLDLTGSTLTLSEINAGFTGPSYVIAECSGTLTGLPTAPIGYQVTAVGSTVVLSEAAGYDAWADANAPGQTINQDHDGDGVSNGVEYFMGLSGNGFTANPAPDAITHIVSWPKGGSYTGAYPTDYVIQVSDDLATWTNVPAGNLTIDGDSVDYDLDTAPAGAKKFARLKVTGP